VALLLVAAYASINVGIGYCGSDTNGILDQNVLPLEVRSAQSKLSHDLGNSLIECGSRGYRSVRSIGVNQLASPLGNDAVKITPPDLGFSIKDRLPSSGVPILSEVVSKKYSDQARGDGDEQLNEVGFHEDEVWIQIAGGVIGIALGCLLISLHNVIGMARRGQAPNLIRRLPRRRHLRLVLLLHFLVRL